MSGHDEGGCDGVGGYDGGGGERSAGRGNGAPDAGARRAVSDYRAASDALDERPSAHVRAAILAAAAREVGARPHDVAAGAPPARPLRGRSALRWPMAAAATVLLSSVAVMMASRVEEAQKVAETAAPPVAPAPTTAAPPIADHRAQDAAVPIAPSAPPSPAAQSSRAREAVPGKPAAAPPIASPSTPASPIRQVPRDESRAAPPPFPEARERSVPIAPPSAPPAPPLAAPPAPPPAPAAVTTDHAPTGASAAPPAAAPAAERALRDLGTLRKPELSSQERAPRAARSEAGSAPAVAPGAAQSADRSLGNAQRADGMLEEEAALSADEWLARIVRLREAGRHGEADAQLLRFRQRYPQVTVPTRALPPAGTR